MIPRLPRGRAAALALLLWAVTAPATVLQDMEREVSGMAAAIAPHVVTVQATFRNASDENPFGSIVNIGSGLLVDSIGYVLTAASVVARASVLAPVVSVIDHEDRTHEALLYGVDSTLRIAILYVPAMAGPRPLPTKQSVWKRGVFALVVGNSFGVGPSVTLTTVAGQRDRDGFWQLSDPATPGFSGAPVFDSRGALGGIIVGEVASQNRDQRPLPAVMVTSRQLAPVIRRLNSIASRPGYPWLGISVRPQTLPDGGISLVVSSVITGSPAAQAGFLSGDVVTKVDTMDVTYVGDFADWVRRSHPGDQATVRVVRQGMQQDIRVTIGRK